MPVCEICKEETTNCFTDGDIHVCEEHFEEFMGKEFGVWRQNDHEEAEHWEGGFYDGYNAREDSWYDTGIYWTEY